MCKSLTFALQALLVRHEQYMHDAEQDRLDLAVKIEQLESDKRELEDQNAQTIRENRGLLNELEGLNGTLAESDMHIQSLEATLQSTRQEVRKLEGLAARTHELELQLASLEQEQEILQRTIVISKEEERGSIQRWRAAERKLSDLRDQLERIEREAREEKERHVEVLGRMERQRAVERELDTAAGRLKGAAASTAGNGKGHVVSHFVKDILQDNANLQLGIVELRELLMNSNDEVQMLREQLLMHQPVSDENEEGPATLRAELAPKEPAGPPQVISQSVHIHHHYHIPKKDETRRSRKKRTSLNATLFTPPKKLQSPTSTRSQDTTNTIISQTSVTVPSPRTPCQNRWSLQSGQLSEFAPSSVPSSPQSIYRNSGLFDRGVDIDSSRPTSPGSSVDPLSPQFQPYHRKRVSEVSTRSFATAMSFQPHVIHEEEDDDDVEELPDLQEAPSDPSVDETLTLSNASQESGQEYLVQDDDWASSFQPTLRRSTSHESILSIGGIDIHTLKSRPSQIAITGGNALLRSRNRLGTPSSIVSMETITASSLITARPELSRHYDSSAYLRSAMRSAKDGSDTRSVSSSGSGSTEGVRSSTKLGGWVFGRWGSSPAKSPSSAATHLRNTSQFRAVSTPIGSPDPLRLFMGRPPGINQKGPVPGFVKKADRAPSQVKPLPGGVDHDSLREVLGE
jgi:hypothetical protein